MNEKGIAPAALLLVTVLIAVITITGNWLFNDILGKAKLLILTKDASNTQSLSSTSNKYLDILFVSDKYSKKELSKYHSDVDKAISSFLSVEPFKSRAEQIHFDSIDNLSDLECKSDNINLFTCNPLRVLDARDKAGIKADSIIVLVNIDNDARSTASIGANIAYVNANYSRKMTVVHEFAHSFAGLLDEYIDSSSSKGDTISKVNKNCFQGFPPAPEWSQIVPLNNYILGCDGKPNWYRTSNISIMSDSDINYFNTISFKIINSQLDKYTGTYSDNISPDVTIISPTDGDTNSYLILVKAAATDDKEVTRTELWINDKLYQTNYQPPYDFNWKTLDLKNGRYILQVKAYDTKENIGYSNKILMNLQKDNISLSSVNSNICRGVYQMVERDYMIGEQVYFSASVDASPIITIVGNDYEEGVSNCTNWGDNEIAKYCIASKVGTYKWTVYWQTNDKQSGKDILCSQSIDYKIIEK